FPGKTYDQALSQWNRVTGTTLRCWKVYYQEGEFPTRIEPQVRTMIDHGIQALISFKPSRKHLTPAERGRLSAAVTMFRKHGLLAETCLWQEVGRRSCRRRSITSTCGTSARRSASTTRWCSTRPGSPGRASGRRTTRPTSTWTATPWTFTAAASSKSTEGWTG